MDWAQHPAARAKSSKVRRGGTLLYAMTILVPISDLFKDLPDNEKGRTQWFALKQVLFNTH